MSAGVLLFNLPWTGAVMGDDIKALCNAESLSDQELFERIRTFGLKHHVRTLMATAGAAIAVGMLLKRK